MISVKSFFTDSFAHVDALIHHYVQTAYTNLVTAHQGTITLLLTFYVMHLGYRFLTRTLEGDLITLMRQLVVMLCVYGLLMNWPLYHLFIYNIFTNEPYHIATVLVEASGQASAQSTLNHLFETILKTCQAIFGEAGLSQNGIVFALYGILVLVCALPLCIQAFLLFVYTKIAMSILLALAPLFLVFILWQSTQNLFASWLRQLITLALIPILTSAVLALMLSLIHVTLPLIDESSELSFLSLAPFLALSIATALMLKQVLSISSALGSGLTLLPVSQGVAFAQNALSYSTSALRLGLSGIKKLPWHPLPRQPVSPLRAPPPPPFSKDS